MRSLSVRLILLFSFLYVTSCNHRQAPQQLTVNGPGVTGSWKVEGCASEKSPGKITKEKQVDNFTLTDDPVITIKGDSITYSRTLTHLCCRQARLNIYKKDSLLTIQEYWYNQGCKCHCNSTVSAVLNKIAAGNYQLYIIEAGTNPFDDKPMPSQDTIWTQRVIIK